MGRLREVEAPYRARNIMYRRYVRDQASSKLTLSFGTRWEYIALYNPQTNMVEIGGIAGLVLNLQFGRVASTTLTTQIGDTRFDALQPRLDRRFANGIRIRGDRQHRGRFRTAD